MALDLKTEIGCVSDRAKLYCCTCILKFDNLWDFDFIQVVFVKSSLYNTTV